MGSLPFLELFGVSSEARLELLREEMPYEVLRESSFGDFGEVVRHV